MKPAGVYNLNYIVEYIFPVLPFFAVFYKSKDLRCVKTRIAAIGELLPGRSEGPAEGVIDLWRGQKQYSTEKYFCHHKKSYLNDTLKIRATFKLSQ